VKDKDKEDEGPHLILPGGYGGNEVTF